MENYLRNSENLNSKKKYCICLIFFKEIKKECKKIKKEGKKVVSFKKRKLNISKNYH